jgi:hypothetical protein
MEPDHTSGPPPPAAAAAAKAMASELQNRLFLPGTAGGPPAGLGPRFNPTQPALKTGHGRSVDSARSSAGRGRGFRLPPVNAQPPQDVTFSPHRKLPPPAGLAATGQQTPATSAVPVRPPSTSIYAGDAAVGALASASMVAVLDHVRAQGPSFGFLYALPAEPRASVRRSMYNLRVVPYSAVDEEEYFTISAAGVTHITPTSSEFHSLDGFQADAVLTARLTALPLFAQFRQWKAFTTWRNAITSARSKSRSEALQKQLFILSAHLQPALLEIRAMCLDVVEMRLITIDPAETYTLDAFLAAQHEQMDRVTHKLNGFRDAIAAVAQAACTRALEASSYQGKGFRPVVSPCPRPSAGAVSLLLWD